MAIKLILVGAIFLLVLVGGVIYFSNSSSEDSNIIDEDKQIEGLKLLGIDTQETEEFFDKWGKDN